MLKHGDVCEAAGVVGAGVVAVPAVEGRNVRTTVRMLVMDVDGTLTDGTIYMSAEGECLKAFNVRDGLGIGELLPRAGIVPVIITGRGCAALERRAAELGICELHEHVADKPAKMREVAERLGCGLGEVAYIGDDLNDLPCMQAVHEAGGVVGCPADAAPEVLAVADYVAAHNGGRGAVREFIDWLVAGDAAKTAEPGQAQAAPSEEGRTC